MPKTTPNSRKNDKRGNSYDRKRRLATLAVGAAHEDAPIVTVAVVLRSGKVVKPFDRQMPLYGACCNCGVEVDFGIRMNAPERAGMDRPEPRAPYGVHVLVGDEKLYGDNVAEQDRIGSFDADGNWNAGSYTLDNLQIACRRCNRDKGDKGYFA